MAQRPHRVTGLDCLMRPKVPGTQGYIYPAGQSKGMELPSQSQGHCSNGAKVPASPAGHRASRWEVGETDTKGVCSQVGLDRPLLPPTPTATFLANSRAPVGSLTARLTLSINLIPGGCSGGNRGSCLHLF